MTYPTLSVIVPTIGRRSLARTLLSFAPDIGQGDHVYVMCDGWGTWNKVVSLIEWFRWNFKGQWHCFPSAPQGCWGHPLRNIALDKVTTDYVWTIDDDDIAAPGAIEAFRDMTSPWAIFRMRFGIGHPANGITCWRDTRLQHGDIGTPMILAKPCAARFGLEYAGDWEYVQSLQAELGDPEWDTRVVALIRPEETDATP